MHLEIAELEDAYLEFIQMANVLSIITRDIYNLEVHIRFGSRWVCASFVVVVYLLCIVYFDWYLI
jgi:hypothetical protein